jgi:hypothetical protein
VRLGADAEHLSSVGAARHASTRARCGW